MTPTIISCAVTGTFPTREHNENLPVTPAEIAEACIGAAKAGAAICHIHVRDPETGRPSMKLEHYKEVVERIRASDTDLLINLTTGPGGRFMPSDDEPARAAPGTMLTTPEIRTEHVVELKPDICSLDLNTMWFGGGAVINSPRSIRIMAERIYAAGVKPELEVFDSGDIALAHDLLAEGVLKAPLLFQIVTGIKYGFVSTPETLAYARSLLPAGCAWAAFGASRMAFPMAAQAFLLGGHVRVGMEDTVYLAKGVKAPSNAALVAKARHIIEELGGEIATVDQARELLELPARR
ncbi:MAG: 3-keto-5-aminohexanoate cleavage protein [Ectothiorhodospiraceae bacterium]|nr:3-keto-5-aminohexanoate cleavage protein [Ectothiorhodospiraceae bacterium]